ncbi:cytochrome bd-II oxidase subunit CbdX [Escherichia coli]|nr:cytochrome bd-II oxidase subunit CbdX [Escherichia coli]
MWYLLWFVGILLMCSLSTLVLVWLDPRLKKLTNVGLMRRISIASGNQ